MRTPDYLRDHPQHGRAGVERIYRFPNGLGATVQWVFGGNNSGFLVQPVRFTGVEITVFENWDESENTHSEEEVDTILDEIAAYSGPVEVEDPAPNAVVTVVEAAPAAVQTGEANAQSDVPADTPIPVVVDVAGGAVVDTGVDTVVDTTGVVAVDDTAAAPGPVAIETAPAEVPDTPAADAAAGGTAVEPTPAVVADVPDADQFPAPTKTFLDEEIDRLAAETTGQAHDDAVKLRADFDRY